MDEMLFIKTPVGRMPSRTWWQKYTKWAMQPARCAKHWAAKRQLEAELAAEGT